MKRKVSTEIKTKENQVKGEPTTPILRTGRKITTLDDARKLMSSLISKFCKNEIVEKDAKTLCYLLINYVSICKDSELEGRIKEIETQLEMKR